jgi:hypothetical protein
MSRFDEILCSLSNFSVFRNEQIVTVPSSTIPTVARHKVLAGTKITQIKDLNFSLIVDRKCPVRFENPGSIADWTAHQNNSRPLPILACGSGSSLFCDSVTDWKAQVTK